MSDAADSPALPDPAEAADWSRPFAQRQLQMLGDLAELGLDVARAVERQASGSADVREAALAYARVSRAVRLTLILQSKLIEDLKAPEKAAAQAPAAQPARPAAGPAEAPFTPERQRKARVERIVERLIEAEHPDDEETLETQMRDVCDRLDDDTLYGDLLERPLSELVARLCKDLGLDPDWTELAGELWAVREVESGEVGWPLATHLPRSRQRAAGGEPVAEERLVEGAGGSDTG